MPGNILLRLGRAWSSQLSASYFDRAVTTRDTILIVIPCTYFSASSGRGTLFTHVWIWAFFMGGVKMAPHRVAATCIFVAE